MSSRRRDRDDDFEGVEFEIPFFSMRAGRGRWDTEMTYDEEYRRARRKVRARLAFYRHLATYAAVITALLVLDGLTGGGLGWSLWVAGVWGAFVVWQAFSTFVFPIVWSPETEERMIEEELRRSRGAG